MATTPLMVPPSHFQNKHPAVPMLTEVLLFVVAFSCSIHPWAGPMLIGNETTLSPLVVASLIVVTALWVRWRQMKHCRCCRCEGINIGKCITRISMLSMEDGPVGCINGEKIDGDKLKDRSGYSSFWCKQSKPWSGPCCLVEERGFVLWCFATIQGSQNW